jgi:hypothetical protein
MAAILPSLVARAAFAAPARLAPRWFAKSVSVAMSSSSSSSSFGDGGGDDPTASVATGMIGGWGDPASIERRVRSKRRPAPRDPVTGEPVRRTRPGPSEEDMWAEVGAPGYDVDRSAGGGDLKGPPRTWAADGGVPSPQEGGAGGGGGASPSPSPSSSSSPSLGALLVEGKGAALRTSTASIARASLRSFLRTYELLILPMYVAQPGLLSVRLSVGENEAAAGAGAAGAGSAAGPSTVTVQSVTEWESDDAYDAAVASPEYATAMGELGTYLRGRPATRRLRQEMAWDARYANARAGREAAAAKAKAGAKAGAKGVEETHEPGPELGLR